MDTHLKRLTLITNNKSALLNGGGINDMDYLGYLKYADIQSLLIGSTTVTWSKIERFALFVNERETVRTVTPMADITANLRTGWCTKPHRQYCNRKHTHVVPNQGSTQTSRQRTQGV